MYARNEMVGGRVSRDDPSESRLRATLVISFIASHVLELALAVVTILQVLPSALPTRFADI